MLQTDSRVVGPGEHDFGVEGLERREKVEIRRRSRRVDRVSALVGKALRRRRTGRKIAFPVLQPVILAEGSLEQADAALERQRRPARHAVDRPFDGQVGNGEIEVFDHLLHHHLARIAALFEEQRVAGVDRTVDPGHVAVMLHLLEVEPRPEEARHALVLEPHVLVGTVGGVLEEEIDVAQLLPLPGASRRGHGAVAQHLARERGLGDDVGRLAVDGPGGGEHRVEIVGVELTLLLRVEEVIGSEPVLRVAVERVLAAAKSARRHTGQYIKNVFFHNGNRFRRLSSDPRNRSCTRDRRSTSCPNRRQPARDRGNRFSGRSTWRGSRR